MTRPAIHARIPIFPYATSLQGARLDNLCEEFTGKRRDLVLDYHELSPTAPAEIIQRGGKIYEQIQGNFLPRRLRFAGIEQPKISGAYKKLEETSLDHPAREIRDMLRWIPRGHRLTFCILFSSSWEPEDDIHFYTREVFQEKRLSEAVFASLERDWSPAPLTRAGIVPFTPKLYERFGGDPITINMDGRTCHHKLFIGGTDIQPKRRPQVSAVLNLGEKPSRWVKRGILHPNDRAENKGEGPRGMSVDEICEEAHWVLDHLQRNQSVLVHCAAGMNRSSTICCAVLILLEGLSAKKALERVREHHPWARPDSNHWLKLRWLAKDRQGD
jgi:hypothetical protein